MTLEQRVVKGLRELAPRDRRVVAELVDFLRSRREAARHGQTADDDPRAWQALSLQALMRDAQHPDEVEYTLADARREPTP